MGALSNPAFMGLVTGVAAMIGFLIGLAFKQREVETLRNAIADIRRETEAVVGAVRQGKRHLVVYQERDY